MVARFSLIQNPAREREGGRRSVQKERGEGERGKLCRFTSTMTMAMPRFVCCMAIVVIMTMTMYQEDEVLAQTTNMSDNERGPNDCEEIREQLDAVMAVKDAACTEVCAMNELLDENVRERCGCIDDNPALEDEMTLGNEAPYAGAEVEELRNALCVTTLADKLEWQENSDVVEITDTSLTMVVTEDVVLYTLCHTACSSSCGVNGVVTPINEDMLVVNDGMRTPASSFFNETGELWTSDEVMVVNVLGTEDGTDVSVQMIVWSPVYDGASTTVRFDARLVDGSDVDDVDADEDDSLAHSPEGDRRRRRRRRLQQTQRATVARGAASRRVTSARMSGVTSIPRADVVSRSSISRASVNTATTDTIACEQCEVQGFICEPTPSPPPPPPPSPPPSPPPPAFEIDGDIFIDRDEERLRGVRSVTGSVIISGASVTNLDFLSSLETIGGWVLMERVLRLATLDGLKSLTSINRDFIIRDNSNLITMDGLSNLQTVGGGLYVQTNAKLTSLDGLGSLESVFNLSIVGNAAITTLDGLRGLKRIQGNLVIVSNPVLESLDGLGSLESIGGSLELLDNFALTSLDGLSSLERVGFGCLPIRPDLLASAPQNVYKVCNATQLP